MRRVETFLSVRFIEFSYSLRRNRAAHGARRATGKYSPAHYGERIADRFDGRVRRIACRGCSRQVLASLLYGVHRFDGMVDAGVVLIVFVIALLASYLPARRAMRIDPVRALRQ